MRPQERQHKKDIMNFSIEKPKGLSQATFNINDETLGEALNSAYGEDRRRWEINYCDVKIRLTMGGIVEIYEDLLRLMEFVTSGTSYDSNFLSPGLTFYFKVDPVGGDVFMEVKWVEVAGEGVLESLRKLPKICKFDRRKFVAEISGFFESIKDDLISLGYGHHFDDEHPWGIVF